MTGLSSNIPVARMGHVIPFVRFLHEIGAPAERELITAKLPVTMLDEPDAYVPIFRQLHFVEQISRTQGVPDMAWQVGQACGMHVNSAAYESAILEAVSLYRALHYVRAFGFRENTSIRVWFEEDEQYLYIYHDLNFRCEGACHRAAFRLAVYIDVIRTFAGAEWQPDYVDIECSEEIFPRECLPNTRVRHDAPRSMIAIQRSLLANAPLARTTSRCLSPSRCEPAEDFPGRLEQILSAYICDFCPTIEQAAQIIGTSTRTLQRRLADYGVSYTDLLRELRYKAATRLLRDPGVRVIDVAYSMGYQDPSHFARFFRRIAGVSPREFQRGRHQVADSLQLAQLA